MVYGKEEIFDAEKLIDLLQALEKFSAVRDEGDGSAFKVGGVRGAKVLGTAGDFRGSKRIDSSDRNINVTNGRRGTVLSQPNSGLQRQETDAKTVRKALHFFFSDEGQVFRDFLLEEVVNAVDLSSREAIFELSKRLGLSSVPIPSFFRAFNPELTPQDKQMVQQIGILIEFLFGDFEAALPTSSISSRTQRLRQLIPVVSEYAPQMRQFGSLLLVRLSEKSISRGLNWATSRMALIK